MELQGQEVVKYLNGWNTVRDGSLSSLNVLFDDFGVPVIKLMFQVDRGGLANVVELTLSDLQNFDYSYSREYTETAISHLKCLWTDDGNFFLSLDPYDEREASISDKDNDCFCSRSVTLKTDVTAAH